MKQDWTPRRRGEVYCSPACGYDCTWAEYEYAVRAASGLAARTGWKPHVWENFGWHYCVQGPVWDEARGQRFEMHVTKDKSYHILSGPSHLCTGEFYDSPHEAIEGWKLLLVNERDELQAILDQLEDLTA